MSTVMNTATALTWTAFSRGRLDALLNETTRVRRKFANRTPVFVEFDTSVMLSSETPVKQKYLVPNDLTFGQLNYTVRKKIKLAPEKALFGFVCHTNGKMAIMPPTSILIGALGEEYTDTKTGFLIVRYSDENTFG